MTVIYCWEVTFGHQKEMGFPTPPASGGHETFTCVKG